MTFAQRKFLVLAAWAAMVVTVGMLAVDTPLSWVVIGSMAIVPIIIANRLWDAPELTLSELIVRGRSRS